MHERMVRQWATNLKANCVNYVDGFFIYAPIHGIGGDVFTELEDWQSAGNAWAEQPLDVQYLALAFALAVVNDPDFYLAW